MSRPRVFATTTVLVVSDLARSLEFYGRLGFGEPATFGEPPVFAMANREGFDLMLKRGRPQPPDDAWAMHLRIADLAAEEEALRAAGVTIARGPATTGYAMYELEVVDPDGYRVCFGQDVERRPEDRD
ncbi:MAG: VOC family protein [Polyangia bacterium]|jgi:predicted enzyme related to lactoylglutathione lyase